MSLNDDTIAKLQSTVDLDKQDLKLLNDKNTVEMSKIRGTFKQHEDDIKHVQKDLDEKQKSLNIMKEQY